MSGSHRASAAPHAPRHANNRPAVPGPPLNARPLPAVLAVGLLIGVIGLAGAGESTRGAGADALHQQVPSIPPEEAGAPSGPAEAAAAPVAVAGPPRHLPPKAKALPDQPVHVKHPAPVTTPIISGLAANGIPTVALNAYRVAAARVANTDPSCGIDWSLLAGIGRVESNHGRFAGAVLNARGTSTPRIVGIALDGSRSAFIGDSDNGGLDGDTVYDRAVGPMQFIPSTWARWGVDANGDGIADPFNINDAALAAARYLCAAGGDLRTSAGEVAAVLAYNYSDEYVARVLALAVAYHTGVPLGGIPITGSTSGALPPPGSGTPPVNPVKPPAIDVHTAASHPKPVGRPAHPPSSSRPAPIASPTPTRPGSTPTPTPTSPTPTAPGSTPTPTPTPPGSTPTPTPDPPEPGGLLCSILGFLLPCPAPKT